jgi:phenylpropionate dioxygenase-like ring-hydroxylating dioxygenase large terminal subunit
MRARHAAKAPHVARDWELVILDRLLGHVEGKTTTLAPAPWENEVAAYRDAGRHAAEEAILFRKYPLFMGLSAEWPEPGSYKTYDDAGVPILIVRGRDGKLRAFLNVCRHRGAKVVDGCGKAGVLSCPYHAWTYGLDGRIMGIPDEGQFAGIRAERGGLTPLPLAEKYGMVWVLATPTADKVETLDIDPWLGGLEKEFASFGFEKYHFYDRRRVEETMNWKILVDTFHEGYHIGFLHRDSLGPILHGNITDFEAFGPNHRLIFPRKKLERLRSEPRETWDLMWYSTIVYCLFPNTLFVVQGDHVESHRVFPREGRPDRAVMETGFYIPEPASTEEEHRHWKANLDLLMTVVMGEDFPAGRSMQIGFASGAQNTVVYGRNEPAMIHYHQSIRRALGLPVTEAGRQQVAAE